MSSLPPVCLLAGGRGTRLGSLTSDLPKALMDIDGEPFLIHQLRELAAEGIDSVVLCVGYLGEMIEARVGSRQSGISISYSYDGPGLDGTLGAVRRARNLLSDEFFVLYGDTILAVDYADAYAYWKARGAPALMSVLRNAGEWGPSNAEVDDGFVVAYDKFAPTPAMSWIDYGMSGLSARLLDLCPGESDLAILWSRLAAERSLAAFEVRERFWEIGFPDALEETRRHLAERRAQRDRTIEVKP